MKKIFSAIILAAVFAVTCLAAAGCAQAVTGVKFKEETLVKEYLIGDTVDYSAIKIIAEYENGDKTELSATDKGVSHTTIDTAKVGSQNFTVSFSGKSVTEVVTVRQKGVDDLTVVAFTVSRGYQAYVDAKKVDSSKQTGFYDNTASYKVGTGNGFVFVPDTNVSDGSEILTNPNVATTAKIFAVVEIGETELKGADLTAVVSRIENNTYYFTDEAIGNLYRIEITLDEKYEILPGVKKTLSVTVEAVDGYNAYDAYGLSVMDNLNVKSWADIKNRQLSWDTKKLSEYVGVSRVILHDNITVKKDYLPSNYFWKDGEDGFADAKKSVIDKFKDMFEGSVKEKCLGEDWESGTDNMQRGLYTSDGISLYGNYLTVKVYSPEIITEGGIYIVYDYNKKGAAEYPETHYSILKFHNMSNGKSPKVENVMFLGDTQRTDDITKPAGINTMTNNINVAVNNVIARYFFTNIVSDGIFSPENAGSVLTLDKVKFYDSFSNMVYSWHSRGISVTNSEMKTAGGPLFIMDVGSDVYGSSPYLNVDENTVLESWLTGDEAWFSINNVPPTILSSIMDLIGLHGSTVGLDYLKVENGLTKVNMIAALIPAPGDLFTNQQTIDCDANIGKAKFSMKNDAVANQITSKVYVAPVFVGGSVAEGPSVNYSVFDSTAIVNPFLSEGITDEIWKASWKATASDSLGVMVNPGGLTPSPNPLLKYFMLIVGKNKTVTA